jgi:hypothetical protein
MIKGEVEGWPQRLEFDLMPVEHGRVQVLTRVPPADKDDLVRISNHTGFSQQDVMRMFLVCGMRAFLAKVRAEAEREKGITEVMQDNSAAPAAPDEVVQEIHADNSLAELNEGIQDMHLDPK